MESLQINPFALPGSIWDPKPPRRHTPLPTRDWGRSAARMGYSGRTVPVPVLGLRGQEITVQRPLRWFKEQERQHRRLSRRNAPKVVRDDTQGVPTH